MNSRTLLFNTIFFASFIMLGAHQFPVNGILNEEDEAYMTPVVAISLENLDTDISEVLPKDEPEIKKETIRERIDLKRFTPHVIDLRKEKNEKNRGYFSVTEENVSTIEAITNGKALYCKLGENEVLVIDDERPDCAVCELIKYQILHIKKDEIYQEEIARQRRLYGVLGGTIGITMGFVGHVLLKR